MSIISNQETKLKIGFILILTFCFILSSKSEENAICATPCISNNVCIISYCDPIEKVCVETVNLKSNEAECCSTSNDCVQENNCQLKECNFETKECEIINVCNSNSTAKVCTSDYQCKNVGEYDCKESKCIDGICEYSPLPSKNYGCCNTAADCPDSVCATKYCNVDDYVCYYVEIPGCLQSMEYSGYHYLIDYWTTRHYTSIGEFSGGTIAGATIGFAILAIFVLIFIASIILMASRPIYEKITHSGDANDPDF